MSRVEENKEMIEHFVKAAMEAGSGTYEEMVTWHFGAMNSFLSDISKSLAIIADNMSIPTEEEGSEKE